MGYEPVNELSRISVLTQNLPTVSDEDERRVVEVVKRLAEEVRKRRILVYPYFKDFDRVRKQIMIYVLMVISFFI